MRRSPEEFFVEVMSDDDDAVNKIRVVMSRAELAGHLTMMSAQARPR
jgi:hypothetical protein